MGQCGVYEATWLARLHARSAHALYIHIPFCVRKCTYCDFASWETERMSPVMRGYVGSLVEQLSLLSGTGILKHCTTAYLGGGTPSMLGSELLARLASAIKDEVPGLVEFSCEANPDSLDDEVIQALAESGVTRLSLGVQSLHDDELLALGRLHDAQAARNRIAAAVASGLDVSVDLMCAIPLQSDESWASTLEEAISLGVGHVSVYPLQIEEGTLLARKVKGCDPDWNDPDVQARCMEIAERLLLAAGFSRYEVASYARPQKECRHNQAYWTGVPYLGIGLGASSMLTREAYGALSTVCSQLPELPEDVVRVRLRIGGEGGPNVALAPLEETPFELEFLTASHAAAEDFMLSMRMSRGSHPGLVEHARHVLGERRVDEALLAVVERGLAASHDGRFQPTHDGWLLGNELYGALWDLAEGDPVTLSV